MIFWAFIIGMLLSGLTLVVIRSEDHAPNDKFGSAVAMFSAWCAFGMLLMAGTYVLGILLAALAGAAVLVARSMNFGSAVGALSPYKLPLGIGALISSVVVWVGILNLMEELPNG